MVADALREKKPKLGSLMDALRDDALVCVGFPRKHWTQIASIARSSSPLALSGSSGTMPLSPARRRADARD